MWVLECPGLGEEVALGPSGFVGPVPKIIQESPQVSDPHMWASLH